MSEVSGKTYVVSAGAADVRLDVACAAAGLFPSRSAAAKLIDAGHVRVGGQVRAKKYVVAAGDVIEIDACAQDGARVSLEGEDIALDIRFEDESLIVLCKQAGLVCHPTPAHASHTLVNALIYHCGIENLCNVQGGGRDESGEDAQAVGELDVTGTCVAGDEETAANLNPNLSENARPGIVHRLDANTTGLMLAAKTDAAGAVLMQQIRDREVDRHYKALVHGCIKEDAGTIDAPLTRHPNNRARFLALDAKAHNSIDLVDRARSALTEYSVLERFYVPNTGAHYTLVDCKLFTGRTHQIRAHLEFIGHPIVGDPLYCKHLPRKLLANPASAKRLQLGLSRQFLHSYYIAFTHPATGERLSFSDNLPKDLEDALEKLS